MIKFVLNGYFRSGTTLMWRMMKDGNPDYLVFTEPLHNDLFLEIQREQSRKEYEHGYPVMTEYVEQGDSFLKRLRQLHPNMGSDIYSFKINDVFKYLRVFDSLDRPVILQPNRMHFILSDVAKAFDCKVAHIIRHPLDVFLSIMFSSPKLKHVRKSFNMNPYWLRSVKNSNQYFLDEQCDFVSRYFGSQARQTYLLEKWMHPKIYYLKRFILVWIIVNWHAVHEVDIVNGLIVRYEDIIASPNSLDELSKFSEVKFDYSKIRIHNKSIGKYRRKDLDLCFSLAELMQIGNEFRYLIERFGYES